MAFHIMNKMRAIASCNIFIAAPRGGFPVATNVTVILTQQLVKKLYGTSGLQLLESSMNRVFCGQQIDSN